MKESLISARSLAKFHPRLRMIVDGDAGVNAMRAKQCGAVRMAGKAAGRLRRPRVLDGGPGMQ